MEMPKHVDLDDLFKRYVRNYNRQARQHGLKMFRGTTKPQRMTRLSDFLIPRRFRLFGLFASNEEEEKFRADFYSSMFSFYTEHHAAIAARKTEALSLARHRSNHAARERVVSAWEKTPATWPSAEKAGLYFADLLAKEGSTYEPRTVTGWIRTHAKLKGIRFR